MLNPRKIGLAALAALLALPIAAGSVYAASTAQNTAGPAVAAQAHAGTGVHTKHDAETADDNEPKSGPDTDNVQEGPGNTAEGPENEGPGQETPDKNEAQESNKR
jgi:hypothetical protein